MWLQAGDLDPHVNGFLCSLLLAVLVQQERVTALMQPWQIFLVFLDVFGIPKIGSLFAANTDWAHHPLHFRSTEATAPFVNSGSESTMNLVDDSFGYNVSYRVSAQRRTKWRSEHGGIWKRSAVPTKSGFCARCCMTASR